MRNLKNVVQSDPQERERLEGYVGEIFPVFSDGSDEPSMGIVTGFFFKLEVTYDDGTVLHYTPQQFEEMFMRNGEIVGIPY